MAAADRTATASNADLQRRKEAAVPRGIGVMTQIFAQRAQNAELWDVEGRRYIDFGGGIAVLNVGHRHPKVVAAVREQLEQFTHTMFQIVPYELYVSLAEKLNQITPGTHAEEDGVVLHRRRGDRELPSRSRARPPAAAASSPSAALSMAAPCWPRRSPARWRPTRSASARSPARSTTRRSRSSCTA